jgi:hypothetical protein
MMISATVNMGLLSLFRWGQEIMQHWLSHLLFADATLIFCKANCEHLCNLQCLFSCF